MDPNWREFDMDADIYLSLYGKNKNIKPQKIKTYALYKQLSENPKSNDNFVIAANDTNEISVSFNGRSNCKVFPFDKVLYSDIFQVELHDSLAKSIIQDIIMGLNCFLFVCNLGSPTVVRNFESNLLFYEVASIHTLVKNILKELFIFTKNEENMDSSLHTSFFEIHDNRMVDLLSISHEFKNLKVFKIPEKNCIEIKDLVESSLNDESDISELFTKLSHSSLCYASICHSVLTVSLVRKNISSEGFESVKVGKLTVVNFAKCNSSILETHIFEDSMLNTSQSSELSSRNEICDILRPAFGGNAKTSIIIMLSSTLHSPEKDLNILQFVAQAQKIFNHPEADIKLIIPISLKDYSEEIQELQKDFNAFSKGTGIKLKVLKYRSLKNSITLENEKVKTLNSHLSSLTDSVNSKKQCLIGIHATTEQMEHERKEVEKCTTNFKQDFRKMEDENNFKQKSSVKADEIIAMKELIYIYEYNIKKLESELAKTNRNYDVLVCSLDDLKGDILSLSCDINSEQTSVRSTFDLLVTVMDSTLIKFQTLHEGLLKKLNDLSDIDLLIKSWRGNTESLLTKFSAFIEGYNRNFIQFEMCSSLVPLHVSQAEIIEIIRNNRNEKWPVLSYYFHKVQVFCDSSFKTLAEIVCQLEMIQNSYKTELKTVSSIISSSSKTLKKFVSDISDTLKISQQYFEQQEKNLLQMTDLVHSHHKFKKQFDDRFEDMKNSLLTLKQICLSHNDATMSKWNEIQKDSLKVSQRHVDLAESLFAIHKQMSSYTENLSQQKLNAFGYPQLKDKMENVDGRTQQLLHIYNEMKAVAEVASELNKKGTDKEFLEVQNYVHSQKNDVGKYFDNYFLTVKTSSNSFLDDLKAMQYLFSSNKEELKNNLNFLSSTVSSLTTVYDEYQSISYNILNKSSGSLKFPPVIDTDTKDTMPGFDIIFLDEWKVSSSTPKVTEKKIINKAYEKEKMLNRIKSIVEQQQMSQRVSCRDLNSEAKDQKNHNISTMSLPNLSTNLNTHSKVSHVMGRNLPKLKFTKKN